MVCVRRAWLELAGSTLELEDEVAGYYCAELDLGYPDVREVADNRPDQDGTDDRTVYFGARALSANVTALGGAMSPDEIGALFAPYMTPAVRATLHYVLDRPGPPERITTVRAAGYAWQISGARTRDIHLSWIAPDPVMRDPTEQIAAATAGTAGLTGRTYPLTFPRAYPSGNYPAAPVVVAPAGDLPVRPLLRIYGPITTPVVTLDPEPGTGAAQVVAFASGFRIDVGAWVDVDADAKTALRQSDPAQSVLTSLDWSRTTWPVLEPAPTSYQMSLAGSSTSPVTQVEARWHDGYLS
jgi:hypothetical protein